MRVRLAIIDDHPIFRKGIAAAFASEPDLLIVAEAGTSSEAFDVVDSAMVDVIVLDAALGAESGIELTRQLRRRFPQTAILVLTEFAEDEQLFQAIRAGAAAYAPKQIAAADLAEMIRAVASGHYVINDSVLSRPHVASRVLNQFRELAVMDESADGVFSPLTPREIEILDRVAQGNSNKEIAFNLGISDQTVKNHITSILRKLAVNDRTQAVIYALKHGWIKLDDYPEPEARIRAVR
ncbi:MAG: response regulator transcription factor [Thermomicrobiales bacterium]